MSITQLFLQWGTRLLAPSHALRDTYHAFRDLLEHDRKSLELLSDLEEIHYSCVPADWARIVRLTGALHWSVERLIESLLAMNRSPYGGLLPRFRVLGERLNKLVTLADPPIIPPYVLSIEACAGSPQLAGGKAAMLGRLLRNTDIPQPGGFVITTNAANLIIHHNQLRHRLDELLGEVRLTGSDNRLAELSAEMVTMIEQAEIPEPIRQEFARQLAAFELNDQRQWAVRSSGIGEDGRFSFAGQYTSVLPVAENDLITAYKTVLAGKYKPEAIAYRIRCGLIDQETPMAALVMELVNGRTSGVIYSRDPAGDDDALAVYAVEGRGEHLVDGSAVPEIHRFQRRPATIIHTVERTTDQNRTAAAAPLLDTDAARQLAGWGYYLEELLGMPLDIEWSRTAAGQSLLLQCRPLRIDADIDGATTALEPHASNIPDEALLAAGSSGAPGAGCGTVHIMQHLSSLEDVPDQAILVLPTLPPQLTTLIGRVRAVVAETGSRASHFATVAREWGIPVVVGVTAATRLFHSGDEVTVDGSSGRIYRGTHEVPGNSHPAAIINDSPVAERLHHIVKLVSPLHLTDPTVPHFAPDRCGSFHDLIRFCHEKAMAEMFSLIGPSGRGLSQARRLDTGLPLTLSVVDMGGGLLPAAATRRQITMADVASPLLLACRTGLAHPEVVWHNGLAYLDWQEADRVSGGIVNLSSPALGSYAVIAADYLHLMLRFGYHFAVIDALAGEIPDSNYLAFRFKGGGGSYENRLRRVRLIKMVLKWAGFSVHHHGDLLDARYDRHTAADTLTRLTVIGFVQGKSQLLDMRLDATASLDPLAASLIDPLRPIINES